MISKALQKWDEQQNYLIKANKAIQLFREFSLRLKAIKQNHCASYHSIA